MPGKRCASAGFVSFRREVETGFFDLRKGRILVVSIRTDGLIGLRQVGVA